MSAPQRRPGRLGGEPSSPEAEADLQRAYGPGRVVIPEELAEEVREHPERFRPRVEFEQEVLILAANSAEQVGRTGPAMGDADGSSDLPLYAGTPGVFAGHAHAWALVGSLDEGGQWPEPGDRVLVLDSMCGVQGVQAVEEPPGRVFRGLGVGASAGCFECDRWAILPPVAAVPSSPVVPGGSGEPEPAADDSTKPLRKSHPAGQRYQHEPTWHPGYPGRTVCAEHPGGCPDEIRESSPRRSLVQYLAGDREVQPYVPRPERCDPSSPETHCGASDCTDHGCQEEDYDPASRGTDPLTPGDIAMAEAAARHVSVPGFNPTFEDDAPRPWRVGRSWGLTLVEQGTAEPDPQGKRPDDRLVGMVREEADAALIVDAVNGIQVAHAAVLGVHDQRDEARGEAERLRTLLTHLRAWLESERERYYRADSGTRDDDRSARGDACDAVLDCLDERDPSPAEAARKPHDPHPVRVTADVRAKIAEEHDDALDAGDGVEAGVLARVLDYLDALHAPLPDPPPPGLAERAVEAMDAEARRARRLAATQHVPEDYVTTVVAHLRASGYRRSADIVEDLEAERDRYRAALERIAKVRRPPNRATSWSAQPLIHALDVAREALGPTREEKAP